MTQPFRAVTGAVMSQTTTNNTGSREGQHYDWTLELECGHRVYRLVRYTPSGLPYRTARDPDDALPAPSRARCDRCSE